MDYELKTQKDLNDILIKEISKLRIRNSHNEFLLKQLCKNNQQLIKDITYLKNNNVICSTHEKPENNIIMPSSSSWMDNIPQKKYCCCYAFFLNHCGNINKKISNK